MEGRCYCPHNSSSMREMHGGVQADSVLSRALRINLSAGPFMLICMSFGHLNDFRQN